LYLKGTSGTLKAIKFTAGKFTDVGTFESYRQAIIEGI
jgi:hypothetical protein